MICYVYGKDGMLDYIKLLLLENITYEDEELRNHIKPAFTFIPVQGQLKLEL